MRQKTNLRKNKIFLNPLWDLCVVTDVALSQGRSEQEVVLQALQGGARVIQYREKQRSTRYQVAVASELCQLVHQYGGIFIVNDRVDVALAIGADGVHLGQEDLPATLARSILGPDKIIGVSASNATEAIQAEADGADYLGVGAIFSTRTKDEATAIGLKGLQELRQASWLPVLAIGGIGPGNAGEVIQAGADGIAVVSAVVSADDVARVTSNLLQIVRATKEQLREK